MTNKILAYDGLLITIYVCLSLLLGIFSFGEIQIRVSELLIVLCLHDKHYIIPLTIACGLTNIIGVSLGLSVLPLDFIFGSVATLISCLLVYYFRNIKISNRPLISLFMPCLVNGLIIGLELSICLGQKDMFLLYAIYVGIGEFISVFVLGNLFYKKIILALSKLIKE